VTIRPLRYLGDPILRTPSHQVTRFDAGLATLIEDLLDTVQQPGRAGLAANQIGSSLAAFSYNVDGQLGYLINPRITEVSGDAEGLEGCLSIPGVSAIRHRSAAVTAVGLDLEQQRAGPPNRSGADQRSHVRACGTTQARAHPLAGRAAPAHRRAPRGNQAAVARCP
jgi:peptide deformylase